MRPIPESLRLAGGLLAIGAIGAALSFTVQERQQLKQAQHHAEALTGGSVERGKRAIAAHQCGACHDIPGIGRAQGLSGPSLEGFAGRRTVAGVLRNDPDVLVRWIRFPQSVVPGNVMPDMGISEREARDIAAFLYTLSPNAS